MRSFAIWYSAKEGNEKDLQKKATIHVNLWDKPNENNNIYYTDFGILVEDIKDIENIYLYAPFDINHEKIKDLGSVISNNRLVNAIFNENFTTTDGEPKRLIVNGIDEKPTFVIYALDTVNQIELIKGSTPGTILKIKIGSTIVLKEFFRYYFRIRLEASKEGVAFINDEVKGASFLNNQFTNTEIIDFRLNDIRSFSEELKEQFYKGSKFLLQAIHYLILRNANDTIIHYGKEINSRILENDLWKNYIDEASHTIIAYHIKSKPKNKGEYLDEFSDLSRFQYSKDTKVIIIKYLSGIIILGALSGVLGNLISKFLHI